MEIEDVLGPHVADIRFTGVYVFNNNLVYVRGQLDSLNEKGLDHTVMLRFKDNAWGQYMVEAPSVSHCLVGETEREILVLVPDGHVHVGSKHGFEWEIIDDMPGGPNSLKALTSLGVIDEEVYCVGMGRMVYKRMGKNNWARFDRGFDRVSGLDSISGLKSVDGFHKEEIYSVGFRGEIWFFDGSIWRNVPGPTNIKLESVVCSSWNKVYACGGRGILIEGRENFWKTLDHGMTESTIWDIGEFQEKLYFSTSDNLYRYDGTGFERVDMGLSVLPSCSYLHANDGVMWSVGERNIVRYDGSDWELLF